MTLFLISLVAGILTVLSPCILPLLPIIVGGSVSGGTSLRRALTVTVSLGISVFVFTFLLKVSTIFISVPAWFWSTFSGLLIIAFGVFTLFPSLLDRVGFLAKMNQSANKTMSAGFMKQSFWGDVLVGAALGPVFTTCSPTYFVVLATVLPVSLALGVTDILAYIIGLCASLLLISFVGQKVVDKLNLAADPKGWFKRTLGVLFLIVGLLILTGYDKVIEAPLYSVFDVTTIEQGLLQKNTDTPPSSTEGDAMQSADSTTTDTTNGTGTAPQAAVPQSPKSAAQKYALYHLAPELVSPDAYLNTDGKPVTIGQFKGKNVVLIDFWTYSCINCQRTLPFVTSWYAKYKNQGLVVIGVHTPEFAFEHVEKNVQDALAKFGIKYPVVLDNEYATWNAFGNQFWPRKYLIDIDGFIVYDHIGEGDYAGAEAAIQKALKERADRMNMPETSVSSGVTNPPNAVSAEPVGSPETYFGASRNQYLANGNPGIAGVQTFTIPASIEPNKLYLGGTWDVESEQATAQDDAETITFTYTARDLYFVASAAQAVTVDVYRDGVPVGTFAGADVSSKTSSAVIQQDRLYKLIHDSTLGTHTVLLKIRGKGLKAYTFTFG